MKRARSVSSGRRDRWWGHTTVVTNVICRPYLAQLPEQPLRDRFIDELTEQAAATDPPFELDYWRLNIDATRS